MLLDRFLESLRATLAVRFHATCSSRSDGSSQLAVEEEKRKLE
jgi:hypothetical protein